VKQGDRIAQLIVEKIEMLPVKLVEELEATVRGEGGFGSTGIKKLKEEGANTN
jgi:dUTPase